MTAEIIYINRARILRVGNAVADRVSSLTKEQIQFSSEREETLIFLLATPVEAQVKRRIPRALVAVVGVPVSMSPTAACRHLVTRSISLSPETELGFKNQQSSSHLPPCRSPMPYTSINLNSVLAVSLLRAGRGKLKL